MKLFISYRRKSWSFTTLLAEKLKAQIEANIFVDMTGIDETDFEQSISRHLRESDIILVIITEYTFIQERIHEENDWLRREIALALDLKKPIIPILVDGIHLPLPTELPENIQDIRRMEGIAFYADYFDAGIQNLANFIGRISTSLVSSKEESPGIQTDRHTEPQSTRIQISPPPIAETEETGLPYKKPREALLNIGQTSRLNSNNAATYYNKGFMLRKLKRYDEAIVVIDQAIRLDPNYAAAYYIKGAVLNDLKRYYEAIAAYDQAIHLNPNYVAAFSDKSISLRNLKQYDEALAAIDQAIRLNPNHTDAYNSKGLVLRDLKQYDEALTAYNQAIQLNPNYTDAYNSKGSIFLRLKRYDEAIAAYDQAIHLDPNYAIAYYNKGLALEKLRRSKEAQNCYEKALQLGYGN